MAVKDDGIFTVKKHKVSDIKGTWKATEAYEIELKMSDKEVRFLLKRRSPYRNFVSTEDTIKYLREYWIATERKIISVQ